MKDNKISQKLYFVIDRREKPICVYVTLHLMKLKHTILTVKSIKSLDLDCPVRKRKQDIFLPRKIMSYYE